MEADMFRSIRFIPLLFAVLLSSCRCHENGMFGNYNQEAIEHEIASHGKTVIFVGTSWCVASQNTIQNQVLPYLSHPHDSIGFVMMFFGDKEEIPDAIRQKHIVMHTPSKGGFDKFVINRRLKKLLKRYESQNYVPLTLFVDSEGNILNYVPSGKRYSSFGEVVWKIEHPTVDE